MRAVRSCVQQPGRAGPDRAELPGRVTVERGEPAGKAAQIRFRRTQISLAPGRDCANLVLLGFQLNDVKADVEVLG
jgi:hypothetical protein